MALEDYIQQDAPEPVEIDYNSELAQKGYYGFFRDFYKKSDLEAEERMIRRQRSLSLLGDLAKLGTQTFAASQGARQFKPIESQVPAYAAQMAKLREAKRAIDADYQNKSLSAIYQDYADERQKATTLANERARLNEIRLKHEHDEKMIGLKTNAEIEANRTKADYKAERDAEAAATQHGYRMEQIAATGAQARQTKAQGGDTDSGVRESLHGANGAVWTRNRTVSPQEARAFVETYGDGVRRERNAWDPEIDYTAMFAQLVKGGKVPEGILEAAGFTQTRQQAPAFDPSVYRTGAMGGQPQQTPVIEEQQLPPLD